MHVHVGCSFEYMANRSNTTIPDLNHTQVLQNLGEYAARCESIQAIHSTVLMNQAQILLAPLQGVGYYLDKNSFIVAIAFIFFLINLAKQFYDLKDHLVRFYEMDESQRLQHTDKLQCPRIKEQRDLYQERKKEEAEEKAEEIKERWERES